MEHADPSRCDPSGMQERSFMTRGPQEGKKGRLTCTRRFLHFTGLAPSHKSGTGDHKTVVFAPREYISPPSSRSVSPEEFRTCAQASKPSFPLPRSFSIRDEQWRHVRHCDISRRLQRHWRVSYEGCGSPPGYLGYLKPHPFLENSPAGIRLRGLIGRYGGREIGTGMTGGLSKLGFARALG